MKKIDRKKICEYINSLLNDRCYVGLHSIMDIPTTTNGYENLSKSERAISILEKGLLNSRGNALNHTVRFFGDLAVANPEIKDKMSNYYQGINHSRENYVVVVAIPYFFEGPQGQKMFGGYKSYDSESQFRENLECISDAIFSERVPSEMILGYYTYDDKEQIVSFVENPRYYSKLSQEEKSQFVTKHFGSYVDRFDVNNPNNVEKMFNYIQRMRQINGAFNNTIGQYFSLKEANLDHSHNIEKAENQEKFVVSQISSRQIQIEYPDLSIHNVECYRLAKAQLKDESFVYFIEYYDKVIGSEEFIDSYAILENINGVFCKSDLKIDYSTLSSSVIRDLDLTTLSNLITMKGSIRTQELMTHKNSQSQVNSPNVNLSNNVPNTPNTKGKEKNNDEEQVVYVVLPTIDGKEEQIDFRRLNSNLVLSNKHLPSFVVQPEIQQTTEYPGYSYTNDCRVLSPGNIDKKTAENIVAYLQKQANNQNLNVEQLQDMVVANCRYQFISSNNNQYNLVLEEQLEQIYLPVKRQKTDVNDKDMFQRFMSGTSLGYSKIMDSYFTTEPQLREKDKANLFMLMSENSKLNSMFGKTGNRDIQIPDDSYDLDDVIEILQSQNQNLRKYLSMTPEQIQAHKTKEERQAFADIFSALGVDNIPLDESVLENQNSTKRGR